MQGTGFGEVVKYIVGVIVAIVVFQLAIKMLGAIFGSFTGLVVLGLIGFVIYRFATRGRRPGGR